MAAGKSRFGKKLSKQLGLPFIDLDDLIAEKTGKAPAAWIVENGEEAFREVERKFLQESLQSDHFLMSTGGGTPCYSDNIGLMNANGVTIWLNTSFGHIYQRLEIAKVERPMLANNADGLDRNRIESLYKKRLPYYKQAKISIPAADLEMTSRLLENL